LIPDARRSGRGAPIMAGQTVPLPMSETHCLCLEPGSDVGSAAKAPRAADLTKTAHSPASGRH
jgi:hypothetical protein